MKAVWDVKVDNCTELMDALEKFKIACDGYSVLLYAAKQQCHIFFSNDHHDDLTINVSQYPGTGRYHYFFLIYSRNPNNRFTFHYSLIIQHDKDSKEC